MTGPLFDRHGAERAPSGTLKGRPVAHERVTCYRCGGQGGADAWKHTGWKCYQCLGKGHLGDRAVKLYTAPELEKLNTRRDATRAKVKAKRDEIAAAIAAEAAALRDAFAATHSATIDGARRLAEAGDDFVKGLLAKLDRYGSLSEKQLAAIDAAIARAAADAARRQGARHLGTVGAALQVSGVIRFSKTVGDPWGPYGTSTLVIIGTDCGSTVVYLGRAIEGDNAAKGTRVTMTATVKEHRANQKTGEPETRIERPRKIEFARETAGAEA